MTDKLNIVLVQAAADRASECRFANFVTNASRSTCGVGEFSP
jgi:hypothetical protein